MSMMWVVKAIMIKCFIIHIEIKKIWHVNYIKMYKNSNCKIKQIDTFLRSILLLYDISNTGYMYTK